MNYLFVAAGGAAGAVLRYLMGKVIPKQESGFPLGTFIINIAGAFCIGLITALAVKHGMQDSKLVLLLKVGVCGGFTTFSTFSLETYDLMNDGRFGLAMLYMVASVVLCVSAIWIAEMIVD